MIILSIRLKYLKDVLMIGGAIIWAIGVRIRR